MKPKVANCMLEPGQYSVFNQSGFLLIIKRDKLCQMLFKILNDSKIYKY